MSEFNHKSTDAMFATILAKLESIENVTFDTQELAHKNRGRIDVIERSALVSTSRVAGAVAALSALVGALGFAVQKGLFHVFR